MRLTFLAVAATGALVMTSLAAAATEPAHVVMKTRATKRIAAGEMAVSVKQVTPSRLSVVIRFTAVFKRPTTVGFLAWPCRTGTCEGRSFGRIRVGRGKRIVRFRGRVPIIRDVDASGSTATRACVLAQVIDGGLRTGRFTYRVRTEDGFPGAVVCSLVSASSTFFNP